MIFAIQAGRFFNGIVVFTSRRNNLKGFYIYRFTRVSHILCVLLNECVDGTLTLSLTIVAVIGRIISFSSLSDIPLLNSMNVLSCFDINSRIFSSVVNNIVYISQYFCALRIKLTSYVSLLLCVTKEVTENTTYYKHY